MGSKPPTTKPPIQEKLQWKITSIYLKRTPIRKWTQRQILLQSTVLCAFLGVSTLGVFCLGRNPNCGLVGKPKAG